MIEIQVDREVFDLLQRQAEPLVDTPNDVLRRLLLGDSGGREEPRRTRGPRQHEVDTGKFVDRIRDELTEEWGEQLRRRPPYRYMYESENRKLYFQNFNQKGAENLWYRINEGAASELLSSRKASVVVLTNPADGIAYVIPVGDVRQQMHRIGWSRDYLEVNIDHAGRRWRELDWNIGPYLRKYSVGGGGG